ncbi:MAG: TonB-dependent receptor plug domain-containing protein, partial [Bacteroidia bacterium]|nr:TonB-dependent receptor plug domain-containing protein [Bacteroidia bacterium]
SFAVVDSLGNTYCERLTFVRDFDFPIMSMQSDKSVYGKRELVSLDFKIQSTQSFPVNGGFSLSVTDSHSVVCDSLTDNIISNLLLCSDIKGYVEDPASYFVDDKMATCEKIDVLMLTQGWRRFNTADIVKGIFKQSNYYLEQGQALSGKVSNFFNAPSKKCDIIMISSFNNSFRLVKTDSLGRYLIDGIDFPDSTMFVLKANKPKSLTDVEIIPDEDVFPNSAVFIPSPLKTTNKISENDYFEISKEKYYFEGGIRAINLDEVTVTADKKDSENNEYYSGLADSEITAEQLEKSPSTSIINLLYTIPGIQINGDQISIRGSTGNPLILLDNREIDDVQELSYLTSSDMESIQVFKGASAAIFGVRGGNGVIVLRFRKGITVNTPAPISLARVSPLGYQKPAEFYVPKYDVDSVYTSSNPDLRTTIYWNPRLLSDTSGVIHAQFYTADKAFNYSIVVEGVTKAGELCRYEGVLKKRNE